ncbi:S1 family peptidase [Burkholderia multivorans]|uniref:Serine protease n=2 Tax=Burkholderia multivorans TaxID=87883 RepID=A0A0H3KSQ0_BURM1|nr:serine protease [Burkholderia multivorans]EGD00737.1 hypothetical protein B1M_30080 [Burkholderia sp. TJI49]ELK7722762.1 trypsin-like peptidase domain-containing protein [Burkholderia cenocepacia]ABX19911.1 hypothetical protein Bmul_6258 [Burkholderia multivorans ATCC 17616]MBR7896005.1 trypsin-like peptidase domain-containing protein [Burkholderia multivorans]MBR8048100.1 trypsin-like peptidase domain-containing protein [Burkholderia multivorans]
MSESRQRGTYAQRVEQAKARKQAELDRHRAAALVGVAAPEFFEPRFADGRPADPATVVVSMFRRTEDGQAMEIVGTGFFVAPGVLITAAHVAQVAFESDPHGYPRLWCVHVLDGGQYQRRPVVHAVTHAVTDIALCVLAPSVHRVTGAPLPNPILRLSARDPVIGEHVFTFALPDAVFEAQQGGRNARLDLHSHYYDGHIVEHYPVMRDRVLLPFPSFETSMHLHGGASGGPVFDDSGAVVGINVSSQEPDTDCSYIAKVRDAFDLSLPCEVDGGQVVQLTLRELAARGFSCLQADSPAAPAGGVA